jgi:hypothetical protein
MVVQSTYSPIICLERLRKLSVSVAGVLSEIQTENFLNTSLYIYIYIYIYIATRKCWLTSIRCYVVSSVCRRHFVLWKAAERNEFLFMKWKKQLVS